MNALTRRSAITASLTCWALAPRHVHRTETPSRLTMSAHAKTMIESVGSSPTTSADAAGRAVFIPLFALSEGGCAHGHVT